MFGSTPAQEQIGAHVLGAVLLLAVFVAAVPLRRPLEVAPMRFLGRISFALYIVHFLVLGSLGAGLLIALQDLLPYAINAIVVFITVVAASIGVAWVFTRLIDEPTVALTGRAYRALLVQLRRPHGQELARFGPRVTPRRRSLPSRGDDYFTARQKNQRSRCFFNGPFAIGLIRYVWTDSNVVLVSFRKVK